MILSIDLVIKFKKIRGDRVGICYAAIAGWSLEIQWFKPWEYRANRDPFSEVALNPQFFLA